MGWAEWMSSSLTLTEELELEKMVRVIEKYEDLRELQNLAVALTRQNWHQSKLLKGAVGRIAELDTMLGNE
jgi:hypothetical protein